MSVTLVDPKRCALPLATSSAARAALCGVMESIRHQFVLPVLKCVTTVSNDALSQDAQACDICVPTEEDEAGVCTKP